MPFLNAQYKRFIGCLDATMYIFLLIEQGTFFFFVWLAFMQPRGFELLPSPATHTYCWGSGGSAIWPKGFWPERTKNLSFIYLFLFIYQKKKGNFFFFILGIK